MPEIRDATFLNAVLPFAIGQAKRHGEPLSVLCIELDRRVGIADLLGSDRAEHALQSTGVQIGSLIRTSDFVSRLDDERLLAVLPRAGIEDAMRISRKLCAEVQANPANLPELGGVTISIGAAEFPACAGNVFALFDAADEALNQARHRGRNQAFAAPVVESAEDLRPAGRDLPAAPAPNGVTSR
jgi:diguanylate cyclase (GGDEF)-like protein